MSERRLMIGHTGITWDEADIEDAVKTLASQGYYGMEIFGWTLEALEENGRLDIFEKAGIPLTACYFAMNLCDEDKFEDSLEKGLRWAKIMQKLGARHICMGGEDVDRRVYDFGHVREKLVDRVNEYGSRFADLGMITCYHPHTGTPIQTEEEIRYLAEHLKQGCAYLAPDVGQIAKGGSDPAAIVKDYLPLVKHLHLKDYDGIPLTLDAEGKEIDSSGFACYTPLGQGTVDLGSILDLVESSKDFDNLVMVELDGGRVTPIPPAEATQRNKDYLVAQGYAFRS